MQIRSFIIGGLIAGFTLFSFVCSEKGTKKKDIYDPNTKKNYSITISPWREFNIYPEHLDPNRLNQYKIQEISGYTQNQSLASKIKILDLFYVNPQGKIVSAENLFNHHIETLEDVFEDKNYYVWKTNIKSQKNQYFILESFVKEPKSLFSKEQVLKSCQLYFFPIGETFEARFKPVWNTNLDGTYINKNIETLRTLVYVPEGYVMTKPR